MLCLPKPEPRLFRLFKTGEIEKLRVSLPSARRFEPSEKPVLEIPKGPGKGGDLVLTEGITPQILGRKASKKLWYKEELKAHMLSPKGKPRKGTEPRTDFSPIRKETFKGDKDCRLNVKLKVFLIERSKWL